MAFELHRYAGFPGIAASDINDRVAVTLAAAGDRAVRPVGSNNDRPFGVTHATALRGEGVAVHETGAVVKMKAAASLGHGAEVGHASSNGAVGPIVGASSVVNWSIGQALGPAAAGDTFSVYVNPRQLAGSP